MESTSIYWTPIWRVLAYDFALTLVNPYLIKQLPGRKSDVKDARRIAQCLQKEMLRGSYVPCEELQQSAGIRVVVCTPSNRPFV